MSRLVRPSWDSFATHVKTYGKLLTEAEETWEAFQRGELKSWDVDAAKLRLGEAIAHEREYLTKAEPYLWTCLPGETYSEWEERSADWTPEEYAQCVHEYYSTPRRRARNRYAEQQAEKLASRKAAA